MGSVLPSHFRIREGNDSAVNRRHDQQLDKDSETWLHTANVIVRWTSAEDVFVDKSCAPLSIDYPNQFPLGSVSMSQLLGAPY